MKEEIKKVVSNTPASIRERGFFSGFSECSVKRNSGGAFYSGTMQKTFEKPERIKRRVLWLTLR